MPHAAPSCLLFAVLATQAEICYWADENGIISPHVVVWITFWNLTKHILYTTKLEFSNNKIWVTCASLWKIINLYGLFTFSVHDLAILYGDLVAHGNCSDRHDAPPDALSTVATRGHCDHDLIVPLEPHCSSGFQTTLDVCTPVSNELFVSVTGMPMVQRKSKSAGWSHFAIFMLRFFTKYGIVRVNFGGIHQVDAIERNVPTHVQVKLNGLQCFISSLYQINSRWPWMSSVNHA